MKDMGLMRLVSFLGLMAFVPSVSAADAALEKLLRARRFEQTFQETVLRLAHDPTGIVAYEALSTLEPALARYSPKRFRAMVTRAERTYARRSRPAVEFLSAVRALVPTPDALHDPAGAQATLRQIMARPGQPVLSMLARWVLARNLAPLEPAKAAALLSRILSAREVAPPPRLRAKVRLFQGVCLARTGEHAAAAAAYRFGLKESGELSAPEGGTLEPFFRHGLADVFRTSGQPESARRELEEVVAAESYPAREAAQQELAGLD